MPMVRKLMALVALLVAAAGCDGSGTNRLDSGMPAPAFTVTHLDGRRLTFPADFAGKAVALRFWADWCPFCRQEMLDIEPIYRESRDAGLVVLAVNVGQSHDTAARFIAELGVSYDIALDEESDVAGQYRVIGLPTTYFIDRTGIIRGKILGESEPKAFRDLAGRVL